MGLPKPWPARLSHPRPCVGALGSMTVAVVAPVPRCTSYEHRPPPARVARRATSWSLSSAGTASMCLVTTVPVAGSTGAAPASPTGSAPPPRSGPRRQPRSGRVAAQPHPAPRAACRPRPPHDEEPRTLVERPAGGVDRTDGRLRGGRSLGDPARLAPVTEHEGGTNGDAVPGDGPTRRPDVLVSGVRRTRSMRPMPTRARARPARDSGPVQVRVPGRRRPCGGSRRVRREDGWRRCARAGRTGGRSGARTRRARRGPDRRPAWPGRRRPAPRPR